MSLFFFRSATNTTSYSSSKNLKFETRDPDLNEVSMRVFVCVDRRMHALR